MAVLMSVDGWVWVDADEKNLDADVVVYGDTSGGVMAAVQAARMGRKVILVSQYGHLGGMTSSGLGMTDIGNPAILGGLSREFYHRIYLHYQNATAWENESLIENHDNSCQGTPSWNPATEDELASTFEPKVAEAILDAMVNEAGVRVVNGRLDLEKGIQKSGAQITAIYLEDGLTVKGGMFIDASYEGDLMDKAGVSFVMGREANSEYGETDNGITGPRDGNQLRNGIDPYVKSGDPASGLLRGVNPDMNGKVGDQDPRLQAYCYRMVLTDVPANRVAIRKPKSYEEQDFEILFRAIEGGQTSGFFKTSRMPNRKTDSNNASGISTDLIGGNYGEGWNWATLDHRQRETLAARHRDWQLGMLWTLQQHPRVPETVRKAHAMWGLPADEFKDNEHWPYNLYIREARRMKSDFVMTEQHCKCNLPVDDPIGMGAYTLDSHNVQRFVHNGMVKNEGDIQTYLGGKAYGISNRAITPPAEQCENLLVPWALSSTHIAFGSIRMEPVSMILGQSAATAAVLAMEEDKSVQDLSYEALRERLLKDGQRLSDVPQVKDVEQ
jgi:hypothetical protein